MHTLYHIMYTPLDNNHIMITLLYSGPNYSKYSELSNYLMCASQNIILERRTLTPERRYFLVFCFVAVSELLNLLSSCLHLAQGTLTDKDLLSHLRNINGFISIVGLMPHTYLQAFFRMPKFLHLIDKIALRIVKFLKETSKLIQPK